MIRRSLMILAEHGIPEFHLWREDDSRAQSLYERLPLRSTHQSK
jgi:hypothetical protein